MADRKVTIQANCQPAPPSWNVNKADTVSFDARTDAVVDFKSQANWPFEGSYTKINLVKDAPPITYSMKEPDCGTEVTYEYSIDCGKTLAAGSGKIIIRR